MRVTGQASAILSCLTPIQGTTEPVAHSPHALSPTPLLWRFFFLITNIARLFLYVSFPVMRSKSGELHLYLFSFRFLARPGCVRRSSPEGHRRPHPTGIQQSLSAQIFCLRTLYNTKHTTWMKTYPKSMPYVMDIWDMSRCSDGNELKLNLKCADPRVCIAAAKTLRQTC